MRRTELSEIMNIRVGSTSRRATREQQARLFANGGILHAETLPVPGATLRSLDLARLKNYLADILRDPEIPDSDHHWVRRLTGLGFMVETPDTPPVCTIAGLVLFGVSPRRFMRQTGVRVLAFEGDDKTYRALLDDVLDGPLVGRWSVDEQDRRTLVDHGLIERFAGAIRPFASEEEDSVDEYMRRSRYWLYPWEAVREALINALAHRDWTRFVDVEVGCYSDRLEVISPGALPNSMTVDKMIAGMRSPRNPIIVEVLRDYGYVDARGMGVRTKIIPLMRQHNQAEPIFEPTDDYLKTTLPRGAGR